MDVQTYVDARHAMLVRTAVLMGRSTARAHALVADALDHTARQVARHDDPDPVVLQTLADRVRADREADPRDAAVEDTLDHFRIMSEESLSAREAVAALPAGLRDAAVLLYFSRLAAREAAAALDVRSREVPDLARAVLGALPAADSDEAAQVLGLAGETIAVDPPRPVAAAPARRLRGVLIAAVALAAVVGLASLLQPDGAPARSLPPDPPEKLGADQVPSVFGLSTDEAVSMLEARGLTVRLADSPACEPADRVLGTDPTTGTLVQRDDVVTLLTASPSGPACEVHFGERTRAWEFLDFAAGRTTAQPGFAPTVRVFLDGAPVTRLTGEEVLFRRTAWAAVLDRVTAATRRVELDGRSYATPQLTVTTGVPPANACGVGRPQAVGRRPALQLALVMATEAGGCPFSVDLYSRRGGIDAVVVRTPAPQGARDVAHP